jgi:hypothetical protein
MSLTLVRSLQSKLRMFMLKKDFLLSKLKIFTLESGVRPPVYNMSYFVLTIIFRPETNQ